MTRWNIPAFTADVAEIDKRIRSISDLQVEEGRPEAKFAFAFDGSDVEIPAREEYPSVTVGYLKVGGALVDLDKFFHSYDQGLVDPRKLRQAMDARSIVSVLPGSMVTRPGLTGVQTWRTELDQMFQENGFIESDRTYSLHHALLTMHGGPGTPAPSITLGKCPACDAVKIIVSPDGSKCPACSIELYLTDVLRTHDEFAETGSNMVPFSRVMGAAERLLSLGYLDWLYVNAPVALSTTLFIQDGPLALHGTTAPLKRDWLAYWGKLNASLQQKGFHPPLVVGVEKSGAFVEHANAIASHIPTKHVMGLDNHYIQTRIRAKDPTKWYGQDEFYGRRFFYKTSTERMLVVTVPRVPGGSPHNDSKGVATPPDWHANPDQYPTLRATLEALDRVQTRMYQNAVIPVALAHEAVALPLGTGSHVLTLMAKQALGLA
ncbi:hypothetical protein [Mycobacteroides abscessus]|uniref:hypothetical protein n=1 Tax=Mycobacteroides abscessus TaxID=36809 RepID=UPI0010396785|nr:hypothetical protein [Mycobacteroides abscessus]MDO3067643.1 hypothetical protein [Mycobacteroides abscessus subsp. bolletii]